MNITDILSHRLKEKRKECGLTLAQVGKQTGLSISFLSDIEVGRASPSLASLARLAECYQTTVAELFVESEAQLYVREVRIRMLERAQEEIEDELKRMRTPVNV